MTDETLQRFRQLRETGDLELRNALVEEHAWVAGWCARRFANRGEPLEDLVQVAQLGVLKAVDRFDPEFGGSFLTFAAPTVLGELRRYFRDATWAVRVPRRAKELHLELAKAVDTLTQRLGRGPTIDELSEAMACDAEDVLTALEAGAAYRLASLAAVGGSDADDLESETPGAEDRGVAMAEDRLHVESLMASLPERERLILRLRFFDELTQSEIASVMGISQVHVSRLLRASVDRIRRQLDARDPVGP